MGSHVIVYTDGSCINNGKPNAQAGIGVYWGKDHKDNLSEPLPGTLQTNQRAELMGCIRALEVYLKKPASQKPLEIRTDSQYTIKCATEWIKNWKCNGWKSSNGNSVMNKDLIQTLDGLAQQTKVKWVHVRGHKGEPGNEAADKLANAGRIKKRK